MAMACFKYLGKLIHSSSIFRRLSTYESELTPSILKSPPLVSLDLPDLWTSYASHCDPPPAEEPLIEGKARVIDGESMADKIRDGITREVIRMKGSIGKVPGLGVILVGERRDSDTYVRKKMKACEETGISFVMTKLPEDCSEDDVRVALSNFNNDPSVHGTLVQLPLPREVVFDEHLKDKSLTNINMQLMSCLKSQHLDEEKIFDVLRLEKDVDGFHPLNMGNIALEGKEPLFIPCTPKGCIEILLRSGVKIMGKKAVVIGRSNVVGIPMALLLQRHHATVSTVHVLTENPEHITREADILVSAAGVPNLVRGSWIKPGAVVLDVGTNPIEDPASEFGYRLIGDVCFEEAVTVASAITPVPSGVGPMTVAMLLSNTLDAAKRYFNFI